MLAVGAPSDCYDVAERSPGAGSGVYSVGVGGAYTLVYCNMSAGDLSGWTVIRTSL